jgi:hypothetical protein
MSLAIVAQHQRTTMHSLCSGVLQASLLFTKAVGL